MHAHQAFSSPRLTMDRNQVVSLVLLIAIVFGLMLDGARAFGDAIELDEDEEETGTLLRDTSADLRDPSVGVTWL